MSAMNKSGKAHALAASLRLPNLPSVWSNTLTGVILGCFIIGKGELSHAFPALLASTCLYLAGNLLNDWIDRDWDRGHRPERALPRGLFEPVQYLSAAILLVVLGLAAAAVAGVAALIAATSLTACIVIYSWLHKRAAWAVIPMACCRGLLPLLGYAACVPGLEKLMWAAMPAALLFVYLVMLTLRARSESRTVEANRHAIPTTIGLLLPPLMLATFWFLPYFWSEALLACLAASTPYLLWMALTLTIFRKPIARQVSAMLAGIPLVDGLFLLPYVIMGNLLQDPCQPWHTAICFSWAAAFVLGRLLQRRVPAT